MTDKKDIFESAIVKLDFLSKGDSDFNGAISALNKKIETENSISNIVSDKLSNNTK